MLKLLKVMPRDEGYADVFIARYERLLVWSLRLTDHDRSMAEDLVQDTFVQFMLNHPDLDTVQNLEGYLYAMLRNTHLSRVRRASQKPQYHLSLVEYDSAEISLKAADVRARLQVQEELWNVCQYACMRKESSKAGSVLILRFFHGYYPSEISKVIQTSRQTVDSWLRLARGEAQLYLEDPNSLLSKKENASLVSDAISRIRSSQSEAEGADAFVAALKTAIFATRQGACLSTKEIRQLYTQTSAASDTARTAIPTENLAHIVSCPVCLDAVNKLLALPLLSDRDPTDSLGP
ncbi:MAG TPA: RNA polymerase sigma factor, partial [Pyrinomonadaceae bacterium]